MKIADVMSTEVLSVTAGTPLKEVARLLVESGFSGFPVIDDDGTLLGVVSGVDVLVKEGGRGPGVPSIAALLGLDSDDSRAEKFAARDAGAAMTTPAVTIRPMRSVGEAAALMLAHSVNRLPVVDADGALVGIVTRTDLLRAFIRADAQIENEIKQDVVLQALWNTGQVPHRRRSRGGDAGRARYGRRVGSDARTFGRTRSRRRRRRVAIDLAVTASGRSRTTFSLRGDPAPARSGRARRGSRGVASA